MPVEVELFDDLDEVARDAAGALERARTPSLFDRLEWYRRTWTYCPPPGRLLVARARSGSECAWLFLAEERGTARALASWYTLDYAPVLRAADPLPLLVAVAKALRGRRIAHIILAPMSDPAGTEAAFRQAGWRTRKQAISSNWRVRPGSAFVDYWAKRPGQLRSTARRKGRGIRTSIYNGFSADAWSDYEAVYAASWKPTEGSPAFLRDLAEAEGAAGTLRLGIARADGRPVAAQLWLVEKGVATIHKLAHDSAADALSPGTLLSAAMFRAVIEQDRPELIDFGTGDDPYKADWMDEQRPLYRLECASLVTPAGLARTAGWALRSLVRRDVSV